MDNPFKPKDVKLFNYNPTNMETKKINNITQNMNSVKNTTYEYKPKTFKEAVPLPKSYGDVVQRDDHYSDHLKQEKSYHNAYKGNENGFKNN